MLHHQYKINTFDSKYFDMKIQLIADQKKKDITTV